MRLDIRYAMSFHYDEPVREAHNEVRVRPRDLPSQRLLAHRLTTRPVSRIVSFTDYWGTTVDHVGHLAAHSDYTIIAESAVETRPTEQVGTADLERLHETQFTLAHHEFLLPSPHVALSEGLVERGRSVVSTATDVAAAVQATLDEVRRLVIYERGSTYIGIPLDELVSGGMGVCQDFAHLMIGLLRTGGIPARYVSGYLFAGDETNLDEDEGRQAVEVQTHAWVEAAVPGQGWLAADPTNDRAIGERHVVIGFGRDYDDVAPVRGVFVGDATPQVEAQVEMRHMEPMESVVEPPRVDAVSRTFTTGSLDIESEQQQQQQQ